MTSDLLVQGGGGAAETSQESAEFDTQTKSSPFLLKGLY